MKLKARWLAVLLVSALLMAAAGCSRANIRGTPTQIDQIITKLDLIDQRVASLIDNLVVTFFAIGCALPFLLPWILAMTDKDYMPIRKRCVYGAIMPAIFAVILGIVFAFWPPAWKVVGVDPLYVKVVGATTNTAQKPVLTADQTQNVLAMRRQTKGYVAGRRGAFVLESPILLLISISGASILGALLAYIFYASLPNIYSAARRHQRTTKARE